MGGPRARLVEFIKFQLVQLGGGQWLENWAKENPNDGGLTNGFVLRKSTDLMNF